MGWSLRCYMPSFKEIGQLVPEKKLFEGFLPYIGVAAILVMWPASCTQNFHFSLYLKANIQNFVRNGPVASEKIWAEFYMYIRGRSRISGKGVQIYKGGFVFLILPRFFQKSPWKWNNLVSEGGSSEPTEPPLDEPLYYKWPWAKVKKWPWPSMLTYLHQFY